MPLRRWQYNNRCSYTGAHPLWPTDIISKNLAYKYVGMCAKQLPYVINFCISCNRIRVKQPKVSSIGEWISKSWLNTMQPLYLLEYYPAKNVVEVFNGLTGTTSKIYYWEGSRVWSTKGTWVGGRFSLFTLLYLWILYHVHVLPSQKK